MFKKPLHQVKTSAPIRASDRRKLKQRVTATFSSSPDDGDLLVPDGIQIAKFLNYTKEHGVVYLDPTNGNPLWFTIGKGSEDLVPTIYTLWKLPGNSVSNVNLLPMVLVPSAVIPVLSGGADLMIPGVITHTPQTLLANQLVAIHQLTSIKDADGSVTRMVSSPLAVGRMVMSSEELNLKVNALEKGKAVIMLHTWKDFLWETGKKGDVPPGVPLESIWKGVEVDGDSDDEEVTVDGTGTIPESNKEDEKEKVDDPNSATSPETNNTTYTPEEITELLMKSLIHTIATTLTSAPPSTFPIPSSQFYSSYILPSRPAFPTSVLFPSLAPSNPPADIHIDPTVITVKLSSHKSLTSFLKAAEKGAIISLKLSKQKSGGSDYTITGVNEEHQQVIGYEPFVSIAQLEERNAKKAERQEKAEKEKEKAEREIEIRELWKPYHSSLGLFQDMGVDTLNSYTLNEIKSFLNVYITSKKLVNPREQAYINLNEPIIDCIKSGVVVAKAKTSKDVKVGGSGQEGDTETIPAFLKRDELLKRVVEQMQPWHEVRVPGKDIVVGKGGIDPIQVIVHSGRRPKTTVTNFEPFLVIDADEMAEHLRKVCAGATSISSLRQGKPELGVSIQGKQHQAVADYLLEKGIPKRWIEMLEKTGK